jgi:hypothetical protein
MGGVAGIGAMRRQPSADICTPTAPLEMPRSYGPFDRRRGSARRRMTIPPTSPVERCLFDRRSLIIDRIEIIALRVPLKTAVPGQRLPMVNRRTIVVRLHTVDGVVSESYSGDTDAEQDLIVNVIHDELAPAILGRSATDPEGAWRAMEPATNDILRERGYALQAIAALDTAIWDVFARALDLPLYRAQGPTNTLPISIIGVLPPDRRRAGRDDQSYVRRGFAAASSRLAGDHPRSTRSACGCRMPPGRISR